jgi:hypothetical protein
MRKALVEVRHTRRASAEPSRSRQVWEEERHPSEALLLALAGHYKEHPREDHLAAEHSVEDPRKVLPLEEDHLVAVERRPLVEPCPYQLAWGAPFDVVAPYDQHLAEEAVLPFPSLVVGVVWLEQGRLLVDHVLPLHHDRRVHREELQHRVLLGC